MANYAFSSAEGSSKRVTFPMHLLTMWTGHFYPTQVLVPAAVVRELVSFDFRTTIETMPELKGLTEESINAIITLLIRQFQTLDESDFESYLRVSGLEEIEITGEFGDKKNLSYETVRQLMTKIIRNATESGLSTLYLRDALTSDLSNFKIDTVGMNWSSLLSAVEDFQEFYAKLTQSVPGGELVPLMTAGAASNSVVKFVYALRRSMTQTTVPAIPARLSYVIDNIHEAMFGERWITKDEIIPGLEYRLTPSVWSMSDLNYETLHLAYLGMLRAWMGFASPTEVYRVTPKELASSLTESMGQLVPALPHTLKDKADWVRLTDPGPSNNLIMRIWLTNIIIRITSNEPSMTASRAAALMDFRKYRADEFTSILEDMLAVYGMVVDAYLDTAVFFRDLISQQRLWFPTPHPKDRMIYDSFIAELIKPYTTFSSPQTNPRYMKEGAHVITHSRNFSTADLQPILVDADQVMKNSVMVNIESGDRREWRHSKIVSGSMLNVKTPLTLSTYLQLSTRFEPRYYTKLPVSNFLNEHSLFKTILGILPLPELIAKSEIAKHHLKEGNLVYALTADDLANILLLPLDLALAKFKEPGMYWVADNVSSAVFWIGGQSGEAYLEDVGAFYVEEIVINDARRFESFSAIHPFFLELGSEIGVDKALEKLKTDLPTTLEIQEGQIKKGKPAYANTQEVEVPIQTEEDVPDVKPTEESEFTSNQLEKKVDKDMKPRKGKAPQTKKAELEKEAPKTKPKPGFEWVLDENSGKYVQKPAK